VSPELLRLDSLLDLYRWLWSWLGTLTVWTSGLLIALSMLGGVVYVLLLSSDRWRRPGQVGTRPGSPRSGLSRIPSSRA